MKSRTSYFNATVLRKNLLRFSPLWGIYTAVLLLTYFSGFVNSYWTRGGLVEAICNNFSGVGVEPFLYAFVCALVLFGDLYKSSLCNALHAMPLRREGWFLTNLLSGILFYLIPTLSIALLGTIFALIRGAFDVWYVPLLGMLCDNLSFLCFFGIAAFSALCVGSRFAMTLVYLFLNFGFLLISWLIDSLYTSQLYGIRIGEDWFREYAPVANSLYVVSAYEDRGVNYVLPEYLPSLLQIALLGVIFFGFALLLYRRRHLESAGDFMAVQFFKPIFLVMYTLTIGAVFYMDSVLYFIAGIVLGFFSCQMLLQRTVRVFRAKAFLGAAVFIAVLLVSIFIVRQDPLDVEDWMPDEDDVESVTLYDGHGKEYSDQITLSRSYEIEDVLLIHDQALEDKAPEPRYDEEGEWEDIPRIDFIIEYHLENGQTVSRYYYLDKTTKAHDILDSYLDKAS